MIDFTYNPIIPADYKSVVEGRGLPYEASPFGRFFALKMLDKAGRLLYNTKAVKKKTLQQGA